MSFLFKPSWSEYFNKSNQTIRLYSTKGYVKVIRFIKRFTKTQENEINWKPIFIHKFSVVNTTKSTLLFISYLLHRNTEMENNIYLKNLLTLSWVALYICLYVTHNPRIFLSHPTIIRNVFGFKFKAINFNEWTWINYQLHQTLLPCY